jgi:multiple sugar transport system substrate-binding protein
MLRSRKLALMAIPTIALLALAGCSRSTDTPASESNVTLGTGPAKGSLTVWAQGTEAEKLPEILKPFLAANPGLKVDVTPLPWASSESKYQTAVAGNTTPDIGMLGTTWMSDFPQALQTVPSDLDTSDIFPSAIETTKVKGAALGVPLYLDVRVVYYRTDLAKRAGYDAPPKDWAGFQQFTADMQSKAGAKWGLSLLTSQPASFGAMLPFGWSAGGDVINPDQKSWTIDSPEMVKGFAYYQSFFTKGIADPSYTSTDGAVSANSFISGETPVLIGAPYFGAFMNGIAGAGFDDKWGVALMPKDKTSSSFVGGAVLSVFKNSKNPKAAWKLIQYLSQPKTQLAFYKATGDLPTTQSTWKDDAITSNSRLAVFGEQLKDSKSTPNVSTWAQISAKGDTALEQVARGEVTAANALKTLQTFAKGLGTGH